MRIVDSCLYAGERDLLELRWATLADLVDHFVVIEGTHSLQGEPLAATEPLPLQYRGVPVTTILALDETGGPMDREDARRSRAAELCVPGDLLLHGDVDEIPRPGCVTAAAHEFDEPVRLRPRLHQWCIDWHYAGSDARWHPFAGPTLAPATWNPAALRRDVGIREVDGAGWHFQHCLRPIEAIVAKLRRSAHGENDLMAAADLPVPPGGFLDADWIMSCILEGRDLLGRWELTWAPPSSWPFPVLADPQRWAHLMYEPVPFKARCRILGSHPPHRHEITYRDLVGGYWCDGASTAARV